MTDRLTPAQVREEVEVRYRTMTRARMAAEAAAAALETGRARRHSAEDELARSEALGRSAEHRFAMGRADEELRSARTQLDVLRAEEARLAMELHAAASEEAATRPVVRRLRYYGGGPAISTSPVEGPLTRAIEAVGDIPSWVPRRICEEQIGDALEQIHRFARDAAPGWEKQVRRKVITTRFWVFVNAIREIVSAVLGKKSA